MKKIFFVLFIVLTIYNANAQTISFKSNGFTNTFRKVDTLFFCEYSGKRPSGENSLINDSISRTLLQFDSSFGAIVNNVSQVNIYDSVFNSKGKLFSSNFYVYSDGTLQSPTSTLFLKPKNSSSVSKFLKFGKVVKDPNFSGYYYLHLNKNAHYSNGDKIFALCDSLFNVGLASMIEPLFVRLLKTDGAKFRGLKTSQVTTLSPPPSDADPLYTNEWNIENTGQSFGFSTSSGTIGADMKIKNAWLLGYTGTGVKVAVIDLGVDLYHPDLQANLLPGYDETGNGSQGGPRYDAYNYHGTGCAGIISEIKNTKGGVGVAYSAKIIPIRFGYVEPPSINPNGYITTSDLWQKQAFIDAVNSGADIISNSWGGSSGSVLLNQAIDYAITKGRNGKGSLVLFAAGNSNTSVQYPATNVNVIAVGASSECDTRKRSSSSSFSVNPGVIPDPLDVSCDGEFWWGSNYGTNLDVLAPGVNITTTTLPDGIDYTNAYVNNFNGTSSACPNTAGVLAIILSANPDLTGIQARKILESTCDKVGGYNYQANISSQPNGTWSNQAGYGRVNVCSAVTVALKSRLSISGLASQCSTSSTAYSIKNLPTGASVTWSTSPVGRATINTPNALQTTISKITDGDIILTAKITGINICNGPFVITKSIYLGKPTVGGSYTNMFNNSSNPLGYYPINNPACTGYLINTNMTITGATSTKWTLVSSPPSNFSPPYLGGTDVSFYLSGSGQSAVFKLDATNICGTVTNQFKWLASNCGTGGGGCTHYLVSPNPTPNNLNVTVNVTAPCSVSQARESHASNATTSDSLLIQEIRLYDHNGTHRKTITAGGATQSSFNLAGLSAGTYIIEITSIRNYKERQIFIKQ